MKNANEIAIIAREATESLIQARKNKALKVLNERISSQVEMEARKAGCQIKYYVDADTDMETIVTTLADLGYEIKTKGRELTISWFQQYFHNPQVG